MRTLRSAGVFTLCALFCTGCHKQPPAKPALLLAPEIVVVGEKDLPTGTDNVVRGFAHVVTQYQQAIDEKHPVEARMYRNRFIFGVMAQIEERYGVYEHRFRTGRAAFNTGSDLAQLGTTAAAAIVGSVDIKDMLVAANVAANGGRLSVEKNFFNEQSTVALLTQMRASRGVVEAAITRRSASDVTDYSLEEAWKDLIEYYNAGTLESAMIEISANAGSKNVEAKQEIADARKFVGPDTPATADDVVLSDKVGAVLNALSNAIEPAPGTAADPVKRDFAAETIRTILTRAGVPPSSTDTPESLLDTLQTLLDTAPLDRTKQKKLFQAMLAAPKTFGGVQ